MLLSRKMWYGYGKGTSFIIINSGHTSSNGMIEILNRNGHFWLVFLITFKCYCMTMCNTNINVSSMGYSKCTI